MDTQLLIVEDEPHLRESLQEYFQREGFRMVSPCGDGLTAGFDWEYFARLHVGATAWSLFAGQMYNPYWGTHMASYQVFVPLLHR